MENKVILIDWGIFLHRSIFSWRNNKNIPPQYTALNMIISNLKKIGVDNNDIIIVAVDSKYGSWRKEVEVEYKANRKEQRASFEDIDWKDMYNKFDNLLEVLEISTPFHIIDIPKMEADDIIAVAVKYYRDKLCIIVSYDKDYEQLCYYNNVRIFSPLTKKYKIVKNPLFVLAKKIEKESSDNLINPIVTEEDYEKRKMIVSLLELPDFVTNSIVEKLNELNINKVYNLDYLPFNSLRNKFDDIYKKDKMISYEKCLIKNKKKRRRGKK